MFREKLLFRNHMIFYNIFTLLRDKEMKVKSTEKIQNTGKEHVKYQINGKPTRRVELVFFR